MKTWHVLAAISGFALVGVAVSGGDDEAPDRLKDNPRIDPPQREGDDNDAQRVEPEPVTIQMLEQPQPVPNVQVPSVAWSRYVLRNAEASRTKTKEKWNEESDELAIPAQVRHPLLPGTWVVARLWLSSDYAPAKEGDELSPAAAFWTWSGPLQLGTTLPVVLKGVEIVGQDRPRMTWVNCAVRINIEGEIELRIVYPGEESTGKERGREYHAVFEWRALPAAPT